MISAANILLWHARCQLRSLECSPLMASLEGFLEGLRVVGEDGFMFCLDLSGLKSASTWVLLAKWHPAPQLCMTHLRKLVFISDWLYNRAALRERVWSITGEKKSSTWRGWRVMPKAREKIREPLVIGRLAVRGQLRWRPWPHSHWPQCCSGVLLSRARRRVRSVKFASNIWWATTIGHDSSLLSIMICSACARMSISLIFFFFFIRSSFFLGVGYPAFAWGQSRLPHPVIGCSRAGFNLIREKKKKKIQRMGRERLGPCLVKYLILY